jgi:hypothetical protein
MTPGFSSALTLPSRHLRSFALALLLAATACAIGVETAAAGQGGPPSTGEVRRAVLEARLTPPPAPPPSRLLRAEVSKDVKRAACHAAEKLTTYERWTGVDDLALEVAGTAPERRAALERAVAPLHHPGRWSRGVVVYPQLAGLGRDRAAVMVVARQEVGRGRAAELVETRTLDIRLVRVGDTWRFDRLASAGGAPVERPAGLPPAAVAVLDHPGIELPDTARWDIHRGVVSTTLLRLMTRMADRAPYGVVVLQTGHPRNVFGTDRLSRHSLGQAVDVYRVGGGAVVESRAPGSACHRLARWVLVREELSQIGSPWSLGGAGSRSFSDGVHQDHLHVAVGR